MIKKISSQDDFKIFAKLLNESFKTIAKEFGLTRENTPTNNAFISAKDLKAQLMDNREFYYFDMDNRAIGFIAIEKSLSKTETFYIEKVAVHPHYRHKGIGRELLNFAIGRIRDLNGERISIGLIQSNIQLKEWYKQQGFNEVVVKSFNHLPFNVCFMELGLK
ncbi:MAG: GNAT family N-acetyltransferase [Tannerella sp.]|jgi:ribosomal protein S18 acetylase RimI-like enzyme|nr:GNAT family N-acetyltransferase [Tannerella sp.]